MVTFALYVFLFTGSAALLAVGTRFTRTIHDAETRRGLQALLWTNAGWAAATAGYLVVPSPTLKTIVFEVGLVVGFATVWAWLYFCSAYTGRRLHRSQTVWRVCMSLFAIVVLTKITNPWHGLYFAAMPAEAPFSHLAIVPLPLYWGSLGLAYCVAAAGYLLLADFFLRVKAGARPLGALILITAVPIVLNVVGIWSSSLLNIPHDALGVAGFALGLLFLQLSTFEAAQWAGRPSEPTLVLDAQGQVLNCNVDAARLLPALNAAAVPVSLRDVLPDLHDVLAKGAGSLLVHGALHDGPDVERHYAPLVKPVGSEDDPAPGTPHRQVRLKDVTDQQREQEALATAKRAAEDAARLKASMLANMSHEVRTPLTSVLGFAELLQERLQGEEKDFADTIRSNSKRLLETLDAVLQLSRLDAGARSLNAQPGDASAIVQDVLDMLAPRAQKQDVALERTGTDRRITGVFDQNALARVVTNLVHNAIKFTPKQGRVQVHVQTQTRTAEAPDALHIEVVDTGIGMNAAFLERATEPFRQESDGMRRNYEGTGLGLAITKHLVDLMAGTLHFQSVEGEGTTATVRIPLAPPERPQTDAKRTAPEAFQSNGRSR